LERAWREGAQQTLGYLFYSFILQIFNDACSSPDIVLGTGDLEVNKLLSALCGFQSYRGDAQKSAIVTKWNTCYKRDRNRSWEDTVQSTFKSTRGSEKGRDIGKCLGTEEEEL